MSEMIEQVAKAIFDARYNHAGIPTPDVNPPWSVCRAEARAAIQAMREPTVRMVAAGSMADGSVTAKEVWDYMIEAALE